MTTATGLMTTEELLAMPDDGIERDLIRGELRERNGEKTVTRRSRPHSKTEANVVYYMNHWAKAQPEPRGEVMSGEAGVRLRRDPDTTVGIDVVYISAALAKATPDDAFLIDGPPILAVEILSKSDTQEDILAKVQEYLDAGVFLVWVVEPIFQTVTAYRPDAEPELFNIRQELVGDPHLPGLRIKVAEIFGR